MITPTLIAVDWGSSSFRAFLLGQNGTVIAKTATDQGIFTIPDKAFEKTLLANCGPWLDPHGKLPLIMGGMIGSRNGWLETPYQPCPVGAVDLANNLVSVPNTLGLEIKIIPGVTGPSAFDGFDVMRGEEIQALGALATIGANDAVLCLPGTHSKWCSAEDSTISTLTTFLTGEMFSLISNQSSISSLISETGHDQTSFEAGVACGNATSGLLNRLFSIRADALLDKANYTCSSSYLSGLLIGNEISVMKQHIENKNPVILVGNQGLTKRYSSALAASEVSCQTIDGETAFLRGIYSIAETRKD
jgi:2-dehydro-3-deoxygalactonokinase